MLSTAEPERRRGANGGGGAVGSRRKPPADNETMVVRWRRSVFAAKLVLAWVAACVLYVWGPHFVEVHFGWTETHKHDELFRLLECVAPAIDEQGIQWYMDYGTLLGAYRENDIIKGDTDIDITAIKTPDLDARMRRLAQSVNGGKLGLREPGCDRIYVHVRGDPATEGSLSSRFAGHLASSYRTIERSKARIFALHSFWGLPIPVYLDFADFDVEGASLDGGGESVVHDKDFESNGSYLRLPASTIFPIKYNAPGCTLLGVSYPCPNDPQAVLTLEYGADWRTPHRGLHWRPEKTFAAARFTEMMSMATVEDKFGRPVGKPVGSHTAETGRTASFKKIWGVAKGARGVDVRSRFSRVRTTKTAADRFYEKRKQLQGPRQRA